MSIEVACTSWTSEVVGLIADIFRKSTQVEFFFCEIDTVDDKVISGKDISIIQSLD